MLDLWRDKISARKVLNLLNHLPRHSEVAQAMAQDDEVADMSPVGASVTAVPLTEWTPEVEALAAVVDRVTDVANTLLATAGQKPQRVKPYPRPVTAFDRARARRNKAGADSLETTLFPPATDGGVTDGD